MNNLKVMVIIGTRPEAVKMAPVIKALKKNGAIETIVVCTAQHREMLDQILQTFEITPDIDLDLMRESQTLAGLTASVFSSLDPCLEQFQPDWILVQGDTTTVMAAALCGYYRHIQVGHVEAGLRTQDKYQPFPEEINRRIAGVVADLHFAPTDTSRNNLLREGIPAEMIHVTGNTVIDALNWMSRLPMPAVSREILEKLAIQPDGPHHLVIVTAHRRENLGPHLEEICTAIQLLTYEYRDSVRFLYPVHRNPAVRETVQSILGANPNVLLTDPLPYLELIHLMKRATLILTDSGGIQEEATALGKPCLVLRAVTERPEGIDAGVLKLVGTDRKNIVDETRRLLNNPEDYNRMAQAVNPFGDGHASERIASILADNVHKHGASNQ